MAEFAFQFWERVDELRKDKSLKDIAEDLGVSYPTIKDMRTRCRYPKQELCVKMAAYFGTSVDYLMTGNSIDSAPLKNDSYNYVVQAMDEDPELVDIFLRITKKIKGDT